MEWVMVFFIILSVLLTIHRKNHPRNLDDE